MFGDRMPLQSLFWSTACKVFQRQNIYIIRIVCSVQATKFLSFISHKAAIDVKVCQDQFPVLSPDFSSCFFFLQLWYLVAALFTWFLIQFVLVRLKGEGCHDYIVQHDMIVA